jgi:hypothetical protein
MYAAGGVSSVEDLSRFHRAAEGHAGRAAIDLAEPRARGARQQPLGDVSEGRWQLGEIDGRQVAIVATPGVCVVRNDAGR